MTIADDLAQDPLRTPSGGQRVGHKPKTVSRPNHCPSPQPRRPRQASAGVFTHPRPKADIRDVGFLAGRVPILKALRSTMLGIRKAPPRGRGQWLVYGLGHSGLEGLQYGQGFWCRLPLYH